MLANTLVYEEGDRIYLVAPVTPQDVSDEEFAKFAFAEELRKRAPNPHIAWFKGHYVEADRPNGNGAMWTSGDLAFSSLTPMLMPVTVMHDPRTAVGTIADVKHLTPAKDGVTRPRIDTVLALWGHRFPERTFASGQSTNPRTLEAMRTQALAREAQIKGHGDQLYCYPNSDSLILRSPPTGSRY